MRLVHKPLFYTFLFLLFFASAAALAGTDVIEGSEAKTLLDENRDSAEILSQKDKLFVLKTPNGETAGQPEEITIEIGDYLFITNEEDKTVHNVYDMTDHSWVLKKQLPDGVAAVKFNEPKTHKLRCAIHPKMQITVNVVGKGQKVEKE